MTASIQGGADPQVTTVEHSTKSGKPMKLACPAGMHLSNADALTSGPVDDVDLGSFAKTGVKITLIGSFGAGYLNAQDGRGGDVIVCRSAQTRVLADPGDVITGPCIQVGAGN